MRGEDMSDETDEQARLFHEGWTAGRSRLDMIASTARRYKRERDDALAKIEHMQQVLDRLALLAATYADTINNIGESELCAARDDALTRLARAEADVLELREHVSRREADCASHLQALTAIRALCGDKYATGPQLRADVLGVLDNEDTTT